MGMMQHHAIIATTWDEKTFEAIKGWISKLGKDHQELFLTGGSWVNGHQTVVMVPDGSKEGWETSDKGDGLRDAFIQRLEADSYGEDEDGESEGSPWRWAEIGFGECGQSIKRGAGEVARGNNENLY